MTSQTIRAALLDLGLEDWIPIPEAVAYPGVVEAAMGEDPAKVVADALAELVAEGKVRLFRGRWDSVDPDPVSSSDALGLLKEPRWYVFHVDDPNEERLFFVNILNIRQS